MYEDFVATKIAQLRKQKNISAREMSLAIGQNVNYINRIEKKFNLPSLQGLFYICEYCNISPKEFFEDTTTPIPISSKLQNALEILSKLNDEQLELVLSVAKALQDKKRIIKLFEGLPKFLRGKLEGLLVFNTEFLRVNREGLV